MKINSVKTHAITKEDTDIFKILDTYITDFKENSILAVTSKIVSITEGSIVPMDSIDKDILIKQESQYFIPRSKNPYNVSFSVVNNTLSAGAGIDESNGNGYYILWPKNAHESANGIRAYLQKRFSLNNVGVIITDSRTTPMRWGVTAISIGYSGFKPLIDYIGEPDIFGRPFVFEKLSVIDNLASASSLVMGEGKEQTPLATITDIPFVEFVKHNPTKEEIKSLQISMEEDLYGPFLKSATWEKGDKE